MRRSIHFAVIVLALIGTIFLEGRAVGTISDQLEQAETYKQNKQYELAEAIYKSILTDSPGTDEAFQAQKNLAVLCVTMAKYPEAQQEVDTLIKNFSDRPELPGEVYNIEGEYWRMKRYKDAKRLCEYIAENHPDSDVAIKARTSVAAADILLGNYAAAQAGADAVIRDFAKDPRVGRDDLETWHYQLDRRKIRLVPAVLPACCGYLV
jgi:tetratricopeptide (TPR) repeat protein